jgi:hypothetical protein
MQPQQPYYPPAPAPAPPSPNMGQYDFITGGSSPQPQRFNVPNSKKMILFVLIGAVFVIGLVWLILSLIFSSGGDKLTPLIGVAQQQTEIVRITDAAIKDDKLSSQDIKNFAENTSLSIGTDKTAMLDFMAKNGLKIKDKTLTAKQSSQTDSALEAAKANGTYESTFVNIVQDQLKNYQSSLKKAYDGSTSSVERSFLSGQYSNAGLLLEQSEQRS